MKLFQTLAFALFSMFSGLVFAGPVNINAADANTIATNLNGIGPAKAQAIVEYRKANGAFKSAEQLANVKGIGLKTVEKNKGLILLGGAAPKATAAK